MREAPNDHGRHDATRRLLWVIAFGVSMGYFEAAVVVYLRALFCPNDKLFPIATAVVSGRIGLVEIGREAFSLLMLLSVAAAAGRGIKSGFAYFLLLFGVWDIFYYVFLKLTIGWPESLMTWDLLFLIPVPWVGPVISPVIVAVTFVGMALLLLRMEDRGIVMRRAWLCLPCECLAGGVIVLAFAWDWRHILDGGMPRSFPWHLFAAGEVMMVAVFALFYRASLTRSKGS